MTANRLVLIISQAVGQLSIVFAAPFLTRIFEPGELGRYQLAFTIGLLLQPFMTLRYELVIPSERTEAAVPQYLRHVARAGLVVVGLLALIWCIGVFIFSGSLTGTVVMAGLIATSYSLTAVDNALLIRRKAMRRLALRNFLSGGLVGTLQVVLAYTMRDVVWLAVAILVGRLIAILTTRGGMGNKRMRESTVPEVVQLEWGRTVYRISSQLVASLSLNAMVLYSQFSFGSSATAYVGMAQRSASAPLGLVSQALTQSVQATVGEAVRVGDSSLMRQVHQEMRALFPYALVAALGLVILGPHLAVPIFGEGWETTGHIIAILGIPAGLQLLISPITSVFYMIQSEKRLFWIQLSRLFVSILLAAVFQLAFGSLVLSIAGYSIGTSLGYLYTYVALRETIGQRKAA